MILIIGMHNFLTCKEKVLKPEKKKKTQTNKKTTLSIWCIYNLQNQEK